MKDNLSGEQIRIAYIPLVDVMLWDENPKKHDIDAIVSSIRKYGFRDPLAFDATLNALVEGHGRTHALKILYEAGDPPPRGIAIAEDGAWCVPVLFGVDAVSEAAAKSYAIDHNNLTLGGNFDLRDIARLWDEELYVAQLQELVVDDIFPISVDEDDLDVLLFDLEEFPEYDEDIADEVEMIICPHCGEEFPK